MPENLADGGPGCLLADLTARVPGARSAVLVAAHGMVITEHGLGTMPPTSSAPSCPSCGCTRARRR